ISSTAPPSNATAGCCPACCTTRASGRSPTCCDPNLLKFKPEGGVESYLQYGQEVVPHLERVGATLRYAGGAPSVVIGDGERPWWDVILIVEYPTPQAFIDMVTTREYAKVHEHRAAGLDRGDLIATSTWSVMAD